MMVITEFGLGNKVWEMKRTENFNKNLEIILVLRKGEVVEIPESLKIGN